MQKYDNSDTFKLEQNQNPKRSFAIARREMQAINILLAWSCVIFQRKISKKNVCMLPNCCFHIGIKSESWKFLNGILNFDSECTNSFTL